MRRLTTLAAALLLSAPLLAADAPKTDAPKTDNAQTPAAAPADSPLVAAAKRAAKKRTGKTPVITNATLAKSSNVGITTTESQPAITLPVPDAALIAMREKANQPQAKTAPAPQLSPAELDRQRRAAARAANAEDAGPYSDTPHSDEVTVATPQNPSSATTQNPSNGNTQNPSAGQTQNPEAGKTQSPDSMQKKKP
jgi:hypothetical protein